MLNVTLLREAAQKSIFNQYLEHSAPPRYVRVLGIQVRALVAADRKLNTEKFCGLTNMNFREMIAALSVPGLLDSGAVDAPTVIETSLSIVFLTGSLVFKVKKPICLPYVDFSTPELRKYFCKEELRLNQRFAPDFYLGLSVIQVIDGRITIRNAEEDDGEAGSCTEYAVRMKQFPPDSILSQIPVELAPLRRLASRLAAFYSKARVACDSTPYGGIRDVWERWQTNFDETELFCDQRSAQLTPLLELARVWFAEHREIFSSRKDGGFIREGHGDLHLGNIFKFDEEYIPFDCLEFNESFRWQDCVADVSFLSMDLATQQSSHLRGPFLTAFARASGDWDGLRLVAWYESFFALVRAKISTLQLRDTADLSTRSRLAARADFYLNLAGRRLTRGKGVITLIFGLSGAGKSWLAERISVYLDAIHINTDVIRKQLGGVTPTSPGSSDLYTEEMTQKTYQAVLHHGTTLALEGWNVIVDGTFIEPSAQDSFLTAAETVGLDSFVIRCEAPGLERIERVKARADDPEKVSDADSEIAGRQEMRLSERMSQRVVTVETKSLSEESIKVLAQSVLRIIPPESPEQN